MGVWGGAPSGVQGRQSPWSMDQGAKCPEDESFFVLGRTPDQGVTYAPSRYFANSSVTYRRLSEDKVNSIEKIVTESSDNVCGPSYSGKFLNDFVIISGSTLETDGRQLSPIAPLPARRQLKMIEVFPINMSHKIWDKI